MENEPGFHVRMIDGRYEGESIVGERLVAHSAKGRANLRPRFKRRTWGTLRVVLSCERAKGCLVRSNWSLKGPGFVIRTTRLGLIYCG